MKAYQRTIREAESLKSAIRSYGSLSDATVRRINVSQAERIILKYEWLGCMPAIVVYCYGIFFGSRLGGAVVYSTEYAENRGVWDKYGFTGKIILLSRGACVHWTPKGSASKLIMGSIRMLPSKYVVVTSTVDPLAGEIGTIYQACNFHYVGVMRKVTYRFGVRIDGKLYGSRSARSKFGTMSKERILALHPEAEFIPQLSKGRYFYFRGSKAEKKRNLSAIAHLIKPYPKREDINA